MILLSFLILLMSILHDLQRCLIGCAVLTYISSYPSALFASILCSIWDILCLLRVLPLILIKLNVWWTWLPLVMLLKCDSSLILLGITVVLFVTLPNSPCLLLHC